MLDMIGGTIEDMAIRLYLRSSTGWSDAKDWTELEEETKDIYRDRIIRIWQQIDQIDV